MVKKVAMVKLRFTIALVTLLVMDGDGCWNDVGTVAFFLTGRMTWNMRL